MKTIRILSGFLFIAFAFTACEYVASNGDILIQAGDNATSVEVKTNWNPAGGPEAECEAAGVSCGFSFKIDGGAPNGTYYAPNGAVITISNNTKNKFDWSISGGTVCAVIVKSARNAAIYYYDNETSDAGLITPDGKDISHVTFCYGPPDMVELVIAFKGQVDCGGTAYSVGTTTYSLVGYYTFVYDGVAGKIYHEGVTDFGNIVVGNFDGDALLEVKVTNEFMSSCKFYNESWLFVGTLEEYIAAGSYLGYNYTQTLGQGVLQDELIFDLPF
jgi:hypothetical protein